VRALSILFGRDLLLLFVGRLFELLLWLAKLLSLNMEVPNSVEVTKSVASSGIIDSPSPEPTGNVNLPAPPNFLYLAKNKLSKSSSLSSSSSSF